MNFPKLILATVLCAVAMPSLQAQTTSRFTLDQHFCGFATNPFNCVGIPLIEDPSVTVWLTDHLSTSQTPPWPYYYGKGFVFFNGVDAPTIPSSLIIYPNITVGKCTGPSGFTTAFAAPDGSFTGSITVTMTYFYSSGGGGRGGGGAGCRITELGGTLSITTPSATAYSPIAPTPNPPGNPPR